MDFETVKQQSGRYVMDTYARFDLCLVKGKNATAWDESGKQYVDFGSGIGVNSLGYCDEGWTAAVTKQACTLQHTSNLYYTLPYIEAAKALCESTGMDKVFFCNSGAEANEGAVKIARRYGALYHGEGCRNIVTLVNSFHGRTLTTLAATGQQVFHEHFLPLTEGFVSVPAGDLGAMDAALDGSVCAVLLELVQGEGGVVPLDKEYVQAVADLCRQRDVLLMLDEVQTGVGRTGTLFAYEQYGVKPNVVTAAKGLGGGLPIGAVLADEKTGGVLSRGLHGSTFGGNPVACAGACEVLKRLAGPGFLSDVARKGRLMKQRISAMPGVKEVRGLGMMLGIVLEDGLSAVDVAAKGIQNGAIFLTAKTLVRLLPPLTITDEEMERGLQVLETVLTQLQKEKDA